MDEVKYPLYQHNKDCLACTDLVASRRRITYGYGNIKSSTMWIGEAPGQDGCDITGIPFTKDRSGEFFQSMLNIVGWNKDQVYVTNMVKCCPKFNRTPAFYEVDNCSKFLWLEIAVVNPKLIVLMGKTPIHYFLPTVNSVINVWDKRYEIDGRRFTVIPHPAFIVRDQKQWKNYYIESFKMIKEQVQ